MTMNAYSEWALLAEDDDWRAGISIQNISFDPQGEIAEAAAASLQSERGWGTS